MKAIKCELCNKKLTHDEEKHNEGLCENCFSDLYEYCNICKEYVFFENGIGCGHLDYGEGDLVGIIGSGNNHEYKLYELKEDFIDILDKEGLKTAKYIISEIENEYFGFYKIKTEGNIKNWLQTFDKKTKEDNNLLLKWVREWKEKEDKEKGGQDV